jgi:hypothetical protein
MDLKWPLSLGSLIMIDIQRFLLGVFREKNDAWAWWFNILRNTKFV